jgi:hypothetical protein
MRDKDELKLAIIKKQKEMDKAQEEFEEQIREKEKLYETERKAMKEALD